MQMINGIRKKSENHNNLQYPLNNIKYLGVTLNKEVKILYDSNFTSLKKKTEEDIRKLKDFPCSLIGRIRIVKLAILKK